MSTTAVQGQTVTLTGEFFQAGALVDPSGVTIEIKAPDGTVEVAATSAGVTHLATGIYQFLWLVPVAAPVGNHVVTWLGNAGALSDIGLLAVQAASSATWCTVTDVKTYTGVTVTQDLLLQAGVAIDVASARPYAVDGIRVGARDLYWLKLACAYQAAWLSAQVDAFERMDIDSIGQGHSTTKFSPNAMTLGPFTKKALRRVSWLKARSLHIRSPFTDGQGAIGMDPMSSAVDSMYPWSSME